MLLCSLTNFREQSYSTGYLILHERITARQTAPKNGLQISDCRDLCNFWTPPAILNEWGNAVKIQCSVLTPTPPVFIWELRLTTVSCSCSSIWSWPCRSSDKDKGPKSGLSHVSLGLILGFFCWVFVSLFGFCGFFFLMDAILGIQVQVNWIYISIFTCCLLVRLQTRVPTRADEISLPAWVSKVQGSGCRVTQQAASVWQGT